MMSNDDELQAMRAELTSLTARIETLEKQRPGRKARPILVSKEHVCGVDPTSNSATCPYASLYRRNKGCKGDECVRISQSYYQNRRNNQ